MTASPLDSAIFGPLFSDPEIAALFADTEVARAMVAVEAALARAQAGLGIVPADAADAIVRVAETFAPDLAALGDSAGKSGVPTISLAAQLRAAVGEEAAPWVHYGATSQDILDTGLVLRLRTAATVLGTRLDSVFATLAALAEAHRGTIMAARTRSQQALPTSFGLKAAGWAAPLDRHRARLDELRPRLLVVQMGGAAGTLAAFGDAGVAVMEALARELDLEAPPAPWQTARDGIAEFAGWLALVTGSLGKLGQDVMLMAQSEIGELREGGEGRGGSSSLPQKANPVRGEMLVAIARINAGLLAQIHQGMVHEHERGGPGWMQEWFALPQMVVACGAALAHVGALLDDLDIDTERMRRNLDAANGLVLAEAAGFALAEHMKQAEAQALVRDACRETGESGRHLVEVLKARTDAPVDWPALAEPANYLGAADALITRILDAAAPTNKG